MRKPMTPNGFSALKRELKKLKGQRPELATAIEVARAHGDLSENADYDAAKNKSGMVEAKIRDIESRLSGAEVIDPRKIKSFDRVVFGLSAKILDLDADQERTLTIVGSEESDVERGYISFESAIGKALISKEVGEVIKVILPGGIKEFEILECFLGYTAEEEEEDLDREE